MLNEEFDSNQQEGAAATTPNPVDHNHGLITNDILNIQINGTTANRVSLDAIQQVKQNSPNKKHHQSKGKTTLEKVAIKGAGMQPIRKAVDFMKSSQVQIGTQVGQKQGPYAPVDTPGGIKTEEAKNVASVIARASPSNRLPNFKNNADSPIIIVETSYDITVPVKYRIQQPNEEDNQLMEPQRVS